LLSRIIATMVPGKIFLFVLVVFASYMALICFFCYLAFEMRDRERYPGLRFGKLYYKSLLCSLIGQLAAIWVLMLLLTVCGRTERLTESAGGILKAGMMALGICLTYLLLYLAGLKEELPKDKCAQYGFVCSFLTGGAIIPIVDGLFLFLHK